MQVNVTSGIQLIQFALPELRRNQGTIVLVSSGASSEGYPGWGAYCISKAALNQLAGTLAKEEPLITTISLRPGVVKTDMQTQIRENGKDHMPSELYDRFANLYRDGKLLSPEQPALAIANFIAEPKRELSGKYVQWDQI